MTKTLVLLTLNEIAGLKELYDQIPFEGIDEVVAVDGGSTDGTREFLKEKGIRILDQEIKGRGEAFRVALRNTTGDILLYFSPDGNETPSDIPKLFEAIEKGSDVAIASRFMKESRNEEDDHFFRPRAWVNRTFTWIANTIWNKKNYVTDTINGYRAIRRNIFNKLNTDERRFPIEYQISIRSMKLNLNISEIPTIEGNRVGGESKAESFPVGWGHVNVLMNELGNGVRWVR
ncbi:MAG: glycosyltransferase family 2 protein [Firmicutes bacterium]|nr:glycosyltransferase family 2 protein [Bacillota bacterium]